MITKNTVKAKIIDVSEHQGLIDWEKVKPQIDGAILRCGYGGDYEDQDDEQFRRNADECTRLGIPFGVYLYSYAKSVQAAQYEADHVLRLVKGYSLSYPVYLDLEQPGTEFGAIERANVFGDIIEAAGYWCGIYANLNWWENHLRGLDRFTKWVAQYYKQCEYSGSALDIWQYTDAGIIDGISGNVDMNECYRDFPEEIKGESVPAEKTAVTRDSSISEMAQKVDYATDFDESKAGMYRVRADGGLNLRTGASKDKPVLKTLDDGSEVVCYGYYTEGWLYVKTSCGLVGFCCEEYLLRRKEVGL